MFSSKTASTLATEVIPKQAPPKNHHQHNNYNQNHNHNHARPHHGPIVHHYGDGDGDGEENHYTNIHNHNIEIEWKETVIVNSCASSSTSPQAQQFRARQREVRFDPALDWKSETKKATSNHLRRLAERAIRKRLELRKQQLQRDGTPQWHPRLEKRSRSDRQEEVFLYVVYCDLDLLVRQYNHNHDSNSDGNGNGNGDCERAILARMFDRLFEDAGIKTLSERAAHSKAKQGTAPTDDGVSVSVSASASVGANTNAKDTNSWLWTSFLALQLEYRRIYDETTSTTTITRIRPPGTEIDCVYPQQTQQQQPQPHQHRGCAISALGRNAKQALFFVHWLSPVFRFEERESQQKRVFSAILDDRESAKGLRLRLDEYVLMGDSDGKAETGTEPEETLKDLRWQLHRFFRTAFSFRPRSSNTDTEWQNTNIDIDIDIDLGVYFAMIRNNRNDTNHRNQNLRGSGCEWSFCEEWHPWCVYEVLNPQSKRVLFLIGAMPAFRAFCANANAKQQNEHTHTTRARARARARTRARTLTREPPELLQQPKPDEKTEIDGLNYSNSSSNTPGDSAIDPLVTANIDSSNYDCPLLSHYEYEYTQEICNLLFDSSA